MESKLSDSDIRFRAQELRAWGANLLFVSFFRLSGEHIPGTEVIIDFMVVALC